MRKRLLQESSLTLNKCLDTCRAVESTDAKMKPMSGEEVHAFSQAADKKNNRSKRKNSADTSMRDCVRNAQHGVKSVSCANQRIGLPASAENHREGEHKIMFTNYKMTLIQKTRS